MSATATTTRIRLAGLMLLVVGLAAGASATTVSARPTARLETRHELRTVTTTLSTRARRSSYGWPVKPFDRQHPVRSYLNDPRISDHGAAFHFGIDVCAADGTAVYAVDAGRVFFESRTALSVVARDGSHQFAYWHIVPVVRSHQLVARHQLLGYVGKGWEHVHFAERRGGRYLNPLRDGGIGPYADHTAPAVDSVSLRGRALVAVAHDTPDPAAPGAWAGEPVSPALLRWRIPGGRWHTAVDFRSTMLDASRFGTVYTAATRQNHRGEPGSLSYYLDRGWKADAPGSGRVRIEVAASDSAGNCTVVTVALPAC